MFWKAGLSTLRLRAVLATSLLCSAAGLAACSSRPSPPAATVAVPQAAPTPPAPGVVGGPLGQLLGENDRAAAIAAQQEAVSSGTRKSWRGEHGAYGFITPGAENGVCREYAHKIFIGGRPQEAKGRACRGNGEWRVVS